MGYWYNSQRQLLDRLAHRVVEIIQLLPFQSPAESGTDLGAGQPEFDVIHLVDQIVLGAFQLIIDAAESRKMTYPDYRKDNDGGAKNSLGWCATCDFLREVEDFDKPVERRDDPILLLRFLGLPSMDEIRGRCEGTVRREGCEKDSKT
jgi:hypothetical protein